MMTLIEEEEEEALDLPLVPAQAEQSEVEQFDKGVDVMMACSDLLSVASSVTYQSCHETEFDIFDDDWFARHLHVGAL